MNDKAIITMLEILGGNPPLPKGAQNVNKVLYIDFDNISSILALYQSHGKLLKETPQEFKYTAKYEFEEGKAKIDIEVLPTYYRVNVSPDESILSMQKPLIPSFSVGLSIEKHKSLKYHDMPKDKAAIQWLTMRSGKVSRADMLLMICSACAIIWNKFRFLLDERQVGSVLEYRLRKDYERFALEYVTQLMIEHRRETFLDGWDVVNLTEKQFYKVIETNQQNKVEYDVNNVALPKFCLSIFDGKQTDYYFFEKVGNTITCGVSDPENFTRKWFKVEIGAKIADGGIPTRLITDDIEPDLAQWLERKECSDGDYAESQNWEWCVDSFFIINTFMLHFGDVTMDVETKQAVAPSEGKHGKKHHHNTVRLFKTYKLVKNWKSQARKKAEITCPAWGVRGHFRHYRNGKTIFVEAYIKGPEKEQYKGKEYALLPYKDA